MKNTLVFLLLSSASSFLISCQQAPTKIRETVASPDEPASAESILAARPVILDVRRPLDYGVSHVPGAINVRWEDFQPAGARKRGLVDPDSFGLARRLALWGIEPERPVLVIGDGLQGHGEEAWVGWLLRTLGVKTVTLGTPRTFRGQLPRDQGTPENKPVWKPEVRTELLATPDEGGAFLRGPSVANQPWTRARSKALQVAPRPFEPLVRRVVLDVRSIDERTKLPLKTSGWSGPVAEIAWTDFFTLAMAPNPSVPEKLTAAGLGPTDEILVVSEEGLESAGVTYALDLLKFGKPRNLTGGLRGLGVKK